MPKQLINIIGVVVAAAIILIAVAVGVVPQLTAAGNTNAQADQVAATNALYQARINQLQRQKQNLPAINATVAKLHKQIPAEYRLDDVFLLVAQSADGAKATITNVTAADPSPFVEATAPVPAGQPTPAPGATPVPSGSPSPSPTSGSSSTGSGQTGTGASGTGPSAPASNAGRTQIPISINVTVPDANAAAKFLDALRGGPRLLANVTSTATTSGAAGITLQVSALAFAQPSTATTAGGGN